MARKSITSITVDKSLKNLKNAKYRQELCCNKIVGFHLQKLKSGASWRFRYTNANGDKKCFAILDFVDGTIDRIKAAETAYSGDDEHPFSLFFKRVVAFCN